MSSLVMLQGFQLYLQLMSILEMLNVNWPPVMAHLFAACGYATNLTPQVGMLLASCSCKASLASR